MVPESNECISIESSIIKLIKSWNRRQEWNLFLNPSTRFEEQEQEQEQGRAAWRKRVSKFLESTPIRAATIVLLVLDLILTVLELSSSLLYSCSSHKTEEQVWWHWLGIGILSVLSIKAIAEAVGLGSEFFRRPGYVVDGAVVIGALFLEAFLEKKGGGLLVVVSLWRVVRVVESAFELSDEAIQAQIQQIVFQFDVLKQENTRLLAELAQKDVIILNLQQIIHNLQSSSSNQC
ncbi:Voltage-gated hydrogen channel 1 [Euphorbia peplus]|nr:Voltage-gated hydrogen channel 1 [Euphorbia peplus]